MFVNVKKQTLKWHTKELKLIKKTFQNMLSNDKTFA